MKFNHFIIFFLFAITNLLFSRIDHNQAKDISGLFLNNLIENNSEGMFGQFNETVQKQLPLDQTKLIWPQIKSMFGEFKSMGDILTSDYNEFVICSSVLTFQKGMLEAKITIDKDGLISGFFITPKQAEADYVIPQYADTTKFAEMQVKFGTDPFILNGAISLPKSSKPTPVVVLVHGSGPHDMDETIGPNKPFKDIAWGLASNGIAVLRYNKRTKQYPEKMLDNFVNSDIYDEAIDDAGYAVNLLSSNADLYNIDKSKIYILGHSLGGTVAPRISKKNSNVAGFISLAGMARRIDDVLVDQYNYLFGLDGEIADDEKQKIEDLKRQIAILNSPNFDLSVPADSLPLNMPAKYWMTFKGINPSQEAKELDIRMMIIQAGRDYQVTMEDFNIWKNALSSEKKVQFKLYDNLNHLMQAGEGKSKPDEYYKPSKVDSKVIYDISTWIKE